MHIHKYILLYMCYSNMSTHLFVLHNAKQKQPGAVKKGRGQAK